MSPRTCTGVLPCTGGGAHLHLTTLESSVPGHGARDVLTESTFRTLPFFLPCAYGSGNCALHSFWSLQILLKEYNFDNRHKPTFTEEDILNIFPVVKHVNPKASDAFHFFQSGQAKVQQGMDPTCLSLSGGSLITGGAGCVGLGQDMTRTPLTAWVWQRFLLSKTICNTPAINHQQ